MRNYIAIVETMQQPDRDIWLCADPDCGGDRMYPIDKSEEGLSHWRIVMRCPDCEWLGEGVYEESRVERLEDELDRQTHACLNELREVRARNMSESGEAFIGALATDLILPEDFNP